MNTTEKGYFQWFEMNPGLVKDFTRLLRKYRMPGYIPADLLAAIGVPPEDFITIVRQIVNTMSAIGDKTGRQSPLTLMALPGVNLENTDSSKSVLSSGMFLFSRLQVVPEGQYQHTLDILIERANLLSMQNGGIVLPDRPRMRFVACRGMGNFMLHA